jgi:hypothetical protein
VAAPDAGAAKLGDTAQTPMPKPTNAAMKTARMSFSLLLEGRRPSASHGLAFGDRVLRSEIRPAAPRLHPSIGSSPDRPVPRRQTPLAQI